MIIRNRLFSCEYSKNWVDNQLMVEFHQNNLPKHKVKQLPMFKTGFYGRKNFLGKVEEIQDVMA